MGGGTISCLNGPGHMTKMATMPIYGKNFKGHIDFKVKTCFAGTVGQFGSKANMKTLGRMAMIIYTNKLGHMASMAAMPIYGKNFKNSSSPEPINR